MNFGRWKGLGESKNQLDFEIDPDRFLNSGDIVRYSLLLFAEYEELLRIGRGMCSLSAL